MVRAVPFVPSSQSDVLSGTGSAEDRAMDQVIADLAVAFALDIDQAQADETKWPMGHTLAFAILTSAALWALIAGVIYIIY